MALSNDIISQFVKITNDKTEEKKESIVYGTVVVSNSTKYVKIDGSDLLTPIMATADAQDGDRVTVMIQNHTATVTGNVSSPAARTADVKGMGSDYQKLSNKIDQFEILVADKVDTDALNAVTGRIDYLVSDNTVIRQSLTAAQADITNLQSDNVTINNRLTAAEADITELKADKLDVDIANITYATIDNLDATNADVHNLESTYANFVSTTTAKLTAQDASIANLQADKVSASAIEGKYANIDFSNVGKAAMQYFYAESGLIQDVVVGDTTITGKLVGVTISGDLIEGNTVKAEKLVIKGTDGLYYKLNTDGVTTETEQTNQNSLDGSVIKAKSITATKIAVDDLVAFGATIGGFHITNSAIYSGVKESVDNATSGLYMDKDGQLALGDSSEYLKYYKDQNGDYHLEISAQSVLMTTSMTSEGEPQLRSIEQAVEDAESGIYALDTRMTSAEASLTVLSNSISSNVTETTNLGTRISTVEQKAGALTVRLDSAESNITTAQSTANTALARTTVKDTREDNQTPSWYMTNYPKQTVVEFKKCTAIGLSGSTYCSLETVVPWNDKSGSYPKQTATVNEKQYWRTGTSDTAWGSWMAASETATNFISFDTTNGVLIGNKTSGSWSGTRAQINSSAFNILDSSGTVLSSYGTTTTIGKTTGNNIYIDSDSIDIRKNGKVLATFDQYGLKIANTNDATGSLGSGTTKPALVIGTPTGYHIEMDNNEIMAKSNATTSSHLFLNMEGGNVSVNNNADRAFMFQDGALYAKNASYNSGNYLGIIDALNDAGNTVFGYGGYINKIGGTNIYGNSISLVSNGNIDVEASWINCRSIAPSAHATYALGIYGEKGWSNIYLGKGDNKTNALHIIAGSSTYLLCGVNSSGQYVFGNNAAIMYYQAKDVGTTNTGNAFKITSGNNAAANNTNSVWLFGAADATSRYIGSYMAYSRTYSSAANMVVTSNGVFGRSTSSSLRYKNSIVEADISELKGLYNLPVKKFKYNTDYISSDDELYDKYLYGFIVEDLEGILPCAVEHITDEDGNVIPEMWNSNVIVPSLLKLIQDLNNRLAALEKKGE